MTTSRPRSFVSARVAGGPALGVVNSLAAPKRAAAPPDAASENLTMPNADAGPTLAQASAQGIFADNIGHARQQAGVSQNGVVYVNTWFGRYYVNDTLHAGVVAFRGAARQLTAWAMQT